jgi:hypothetical protein
MKMDRQLYFEQLMALVKILTRKYIEFPTSGHQSKYSVVAKNEHDELFELIVNRKGHIRQDILTYVMRSKNYGGILIRIDMSGVPHENKAGDLVETPHLHIYDEAHQNGAEAIALSEVTDLALLTEITDSFLFFLEKNKVDQTDISIKSNLV